MKLTSTVFSGRNIDASIVVQPRGERDEVSGRRNRDSQMVSRYTSRTGNLSLIFSPSVALVISQKPRTTGESAWIVASTFYRFTASLTRVYELLGSKKMFHKDGGSLYLDPNLANAASFRMSLFRNALTVYPEIVRDESETPRPGIGLRTDAGIIGTMSHAEAMGFIDILDHMDLSVFSLLAGVVDQMDSMDRKLDRMAADISEIRRLLEKSGGNHSSPVGFHWEVQTSDPFL